MMNTNVQELRAKIAEMINQEFPQHKMPVVELLSMSRQQVMEDNDRVLIKLGFAPGDTGPAADLQQMALYLEQELKQRGKSSPSGYVGENHHYVRADLTLEQLDRAMNNPIKVAETPSTSAVTTGEAELHGRGLAAKTPITPEVLDGKLQRLLHLYNSEPDVNPGKIEFDVFPDNVTDLVCITARTKPKSVGQKAVRHPQVEAIASIMLGAVAAASGDLIARGHSDSVTGSSSITSSATLEQLSAGIDKMEAALLAKQAQQQAAWAERNIARNTNGQGGGRDDR